LDTSIGRGDQLHRAARHAVDGKRFSQTLLLVLPAAIHFFLVPVKLFHHTKNIIYMCTLATALFETALFQSAQQGTEKR
jgi:hypothetical protein